MIFGLSQKIWHTLSMVTILQLHPFLPFYATVKQNPQISSWYHQKASKFVLLLFNGRSRCILLPPTQQTGYDLDVCLSCVSLSLFSSLSFSFTNRQIAEFQIRNIHTWPSFFLVRVHLLYHKLSATHGREKWAYTRELEGQGLIKKQCWHCRWWLWCSGLWRPFLA